MFLVRLLLNVLNEEYSPKAAGPIQVNKVFQWWSGGNEMGNEVSEEGEGEETGGITWLAGECNSNERLTGG